MNKDQVKGSTKQATGKIKEKTGEATGNKDLENKGKVENIAGKAQSKFGDVKDNVNKKRD